MTTLEEILDFYRISGPMTSSGDHAAAISGLPGDIGELASIVHGLLLHEHWAPAYGQTLDDERRAGSHVRPAEVILTWLLNNGGSPLDVCRRFEERMVGTCRNFTVLMVALLRAKGIPARARCGFGTYFVQGFHVDHWVVEYWSPDEGRWRMVDAQIDGFQRERLATELDPLDVQRDQFVVAGDAWAQCRAGEADPSTFGIMDMSGLWFIAGNLMRDLAALNKMEMLPWDDWGMIPEPEAELSSDQLAAFDRIAQLIQTPDASFDALRELYDTDDLRVPAAVFNPLLNRVETL